ncbi:hypothetical protein Cgig2_014006 [Carnegiea gigantea]|uniref:Uncharacterized protein n=1 Tax=Carnegiea gigantea TaxID=171969 RepID=A0A9Q1KX07_9CARY|nr:hypothetical protein Cgig2_014006 [Carnegiea gigantea]
MFSGVIPESLGNLSKLSWLSFEENYFQGYIPSSLGNCQNLINMYVHQNNLSGPITKSLFKGSPHLVELSLGANHLDGPLPFEVSHQINLVRLVVANNKLSGEINSNFQVCSSLVFQYLQGNMFHRHIRASLSSLKSLQELDLSHNNFSGPIPTYLSAISLVANPKLCGGILELHLPKCTGKEVTKAKISFQLKLIISCACALIAVAIYGLGGDPSAASDIYSYGIVVLEMMTGKRPTDNMFKDGLNLHTYVEKALPDQFVPIVDAKLLDNEGYILNNVRTSRQAAIWLHCVLTMMKIGVACSMESPQERISLKDATAELLRVKGDLIREEDEEEEENKGRMKDDEPGGNELFGLYLNQNLLTGEIPSTISNCRSLEYLSVAHNSLEGRIPIEFRSLSMLKGLYVHENNLSGPIFTTIQNLTSLEELSASYNAFDGIIPDAIGKMKNLSKLGLGSNLLSGMVPSSIYNLSSIAVLSLGQNQLHGSLPTNIASAFPYLQILQLDSNLFTGPLPLTLSNISSLTIIDLSGNEFTRKVPWNLEHLKDLRTLHLRNNSLGSGDADDLSFLGSLVNYSNLEILSLGSNYFGVVLPNVIANLSVKLKSLELDHNNISGRIPAGMGRLSNLIQLALHSNQLSGTIPSNIGNLQNLERVYFSENMFTGTIPESLGNLPRLTELYMFENNFQGTIPSSLRNCQNLNYMMVNRNNLRGTIPTDFVVSVMNIEVACSMDSPKDRMSLKDASVELLKVRDGLTQDMMDLKGEISNKRERAEGSISQLVGRCENIIKF